jgi:hypothetical protein
MLFRGYGKKKVPDTFFVLSNSCLNLNLSTYNSSKSYGYNKTGNLWEIQILMSFTG